MPSRLIRAETGYSLDVDWLDVDELLARVADADHALGQGRIGAARASTAAALALARGPLLPDDSGDWIEPDRIAAAAAVGRARVTAAQAAAARSTYVLTRTEDGVRHDERYLREWLCAQAASGYAGYDPTTGAFALDAAQTACLADEGAPTFLAGGMAVASSIHRDEDVVVRRSARAPACHGERTTTTCSSGRSASSGPATAPTSSRPGSRRSPASRSTCAPEPTSPTWDAGTGRRRSSWPRRIRRRGSSGSTTTSSRSRSPASGQPRRGSTIASGSRSPLLGVPADRLRPRLRVRRAARHGRPDCRGAAHSLGTVRRRGAPSRRAQRRRPGRRQPAPLGRIFYSASTFICTPGARSQGGADGAPACLGAQAGEAVLAAVYRDAGFSMVRRATDRPFNIILEVRP